MNLFDLHCDTATAAADGRKPLSAFDLPLGRAPYSTWVQVMAVFLPDRPGAARSYFRRVTGYFEKRQSLFSDCKFMLSVENGGYFLAKRPEERAFELKNAGVAMVSLSHNRDNPCCGGCMGDGRGLSEAGRSALAALENQGLVLDVSHCSESAFWDMAELWRGKIAASHSNCSSVCRHPRNLTDSQISHIIGRGGVIGLNFYPPFLGEGSVSEIFANIRHILDLGGEKSLAVGSDIDGAGLAQFCYPDLSGLYGSVCAEFGEKLAGSMFFENADNFFNK